MKTCYSCGEKAIKDGIFKSNIEEFILQRLPKTNKLYHKKDVPPQHLIGLKPNTIVFYFGSKKRIITNKIQKFEKAYGNLPNSGCTKTNSKGEANFYLDCPQVYKSLNGNVYGRHLHFVYWDDKKKMWKDNLFTHKIICHVDKKYVKMYASKCLIIDALPEKMYEKEHIKKAINIPYTKRIQEKDVFEAMKERGFRTKNKNVPIIVYCYNKACNASVQLIKKLNKIGFHNVVDYEKGIQDWIH